MSKKSLKILSTVTVVSTIGVVSYSMGASATQQLKNSAAQIRAVNDDAMALRRLGVYTENNVTRAGSILFDEANSQMYDNYANAAIYEDAHGQVLTPVNTGAPINHAIATKRAAVAKMPNGGIITGQFNAVAGTGTTNMIDQMIYTLDENMVLTTKPMVSFTKPTSGTIQMGNLFHRANEPAATKGSRFSAISYIGNGRYAIGGGEETASVKTKGKFTVIEDRLINSDLSDDGAAQRWKINEAFENRNSNKTITPGYIHTGKSVPTAFLKHEKEDGFFVLTPEGKGNGVSFYDMKHQEWTNLPGVLKGANGIAIQSNPIDGVISCNPQHLFGDYYLIPEAFSQATVIKAYRDPVTDRLVSDPTDSIYIDTRNLVPGQGNVPSAPLSRPVYGDIIIDHPTQNETVAYISALSTVAQGTGKPDTYLIKITFDTSNPHNLTHRIESRIIFNTNDSQNYVANTAGRYTGLTALDKDWLFFWDSLGRGAKISKTDLKYENRISETNTQKVDSINDAPWWKGFNLYSNKAPRGASVLSVKPDGTGAIDVDYAGGYRAKMDKYGRFVNVKSSVRPKSDYNTYAPLTTKEWPLANRDLFANKTFEAGTKKVFNVHTTHSNVAEDPTIAGKVNTPRPHYWAVSNKDTSNKVYIQRHGVDFVPGGSSAEFVLDADERITSTNVLKVKPTANPAATTFVVSDDVMFIGTSKGRIKAYKLNNGTTGGGILDVTGTYIDLALYPGGIATPNKPITSFAKDDMAKQNIAPQFSGVTTNPDVTQPSSFGSIMFAAGHELYKFSPVVDVDNNIPVAKKPVLLKPTNFPNGTKIVDIINVGGNVAGDHHAGIMDSYTHIAIAENGSAWGFNGISNELAGSYNYDFRNKIDFEAKFSGNDVLKVHDAGEGNYFLQGPAGQLQKVSAMYNGKSNKVMGIEPEWDSTNSAPKKLAGVDGNILSIANMPNNTFLIGSDAGKIYKMDSAGLIIEITNSNDVSLTEKNVPGFTETSTVDKIISDNQGCFFAFDYTNGKVANINQKGERQFYKSGGETKAETMRRWMLFGSPQIEFNAKPYINTLWFQGAGGDASAQHISLPNGVELRWKKWNDSDNIKEDPTEENGWATSLEHMQVMNGDAIRVRLVVTNDLIFPYALNDSSKNQEKIIVKGLAQPAEIHTTEELFEITGISFSGKVEENVRIHFAPTPSSISFDWATRGLKVQYWDSVLRVWHDDFNFKTSWKNGDEVKMRITTLPNYNPTDFAISDLNTEYVTTVTGADKKVFNLDTFVDEMIFNGTSGQTSRYLSDTPLVNEIELWYGLTNDPTSFTQWREGQSVKLWNDQVIYFQFRENNVNNPVHQANYEVINNGSPKQRTITGLNKTNISLTSYINGLDVQGDLQSNLAEWTKLVEKNPLPRVTTPTNNGVGTESNDVAVILTYIIFTREGNMIETTNWAEIRDKINNGNTIIIVAQFDDARGEEQAKHFNLINASVTKIVSPWVEYDMSTFWAQGYFEGEAMTYGTAEYKNRTIINNLNWTDMVDIHAQSGGKWVDVKTVRRLWRNEDPNNVGNPVEYLYLKGVPKNIGQPGGYPSNLRLLRNEEYTPGNKNGYKHIIRSLNKKVMDVDALWGSIIENLTYAGKSSSDITINYVKPRVAYSYDANNNPLGQVDVNLLISALDSPSATNPGHWRKIEPNVKTLIGLLNTKNAHFMWDLSTLTPHIQFSFDANYTFINNNINSIIVEGLELYTLANPVESAGGNFVKQDNFTFERLNRNSELVTISLGGLYVSPGNPYYYVYSTTPDGTYSRNYPRVLKNGQTIYVKVIGDTSLGFDANNKVFADVVHPIIVRNVDTEFINVTTFIQMLEIDPTKFAYSGSFRNINVERDESAKGQSIKLEFSMDETVWYSETDTHFGEEGHFLSRLYNGQSLKVRAVVKDQSKFDVLNYSIQNSTSITYVVNGLQKVNLDLSEETAKISEANFTGIAGNATFTSVDEATLNDWKEKGIALQMDVNDGRGFVTISNDDLTTNNINVVNGDEVLFRMTATTAFDRNNYIFGTNDDVTIQVTGLDKKQYDFTNLWSSLSFGRTENGDLIVSYDESFIFVNSHLVVKYKFNGTGTEFTLDTTTDIIDSSYQAGDSIEFTIEGDAQFDATNFEIIEGTHTISNINVAPVAIDILKIFKDDFTSNPTMPFVFVSGTAGNANVRFDYQVLRNRIIPKITETYSGLNPATFNLEVYYSVNGQAYQPINQDITLGKNLYNRDIISYRFVFDSISAQSFIPIKNSHNLILGSTPDFTLNKIRVDLKDLVESKNFITFKTIPVAGTSSTNNVVVLKNLIDRNLIEFSHSVDNITWSNYLRLTEIEKTIDELVNGNSFKLRVTRQNSLFNLANFVTIRADGTEIAPVDGQTTTQYEYQATYKVSGLDRLKIDFTDLLRTGVSMERVQDEVSGNWYVNLVFTESIYSKMIAWNAKFAFATGSQPTLPNFENWMHITSDQMVETRAGIYKYRLETIYADRAFTSNYLNNIVTNMTMLSNEAQEDPNKEIYVNGKFIMVQVRNLAKVTVDVKPFLDGIRTDGKAFHGTFINNEKTLLPKLVSTSVNVQYKWSDNVSWPSGESIPKTLKNGDVWFIKVSPNSNFNIDDVELIGQTNNAVTVARVVTGLTKEVVNVNDSFNPDRTKVYWTGNTFSNALSTSPEAFTNAIRPKPVGLIYLYSNDGVNYAPVFPILDNTKTLYIKYFAHRNSVDDWNYTLEGVFEFEVNELNKIQLNSRDNINGPEGSIWANRTLEGSTGNGILAFKSRDLSQYGIDIEYRVWRPSENVWSSWTYAQNYVISNLRNDDKLEMRLISSDTFDVDNYDILNPTFSLGPITSLSKITIDYSMYTNVFVGGNPYNAFITHPNITDPNHQELLNGTMRYQIVSENSEPWLPIFPGFEVKNGTVLKIKWVPSVLFDAANYEVVNNEFEHTVSSLMVFDISISDFNIVVSGTTMSPKISFENISNADLERVGIVAEYQYEGDNQWMSFEINKPIPNAEFENGKKIKIRFSESDIFDYQNYLLRDSIKEITLRNLKESYNFKTLAWNSINVTGSAYEGILSINELPMGFRAEFELNGSDQWLPYSEMKGLKNGDRIKGKVIVIDRRLAMMIENGELIIENIEYELTINTLAKRNIYISSATEATFEFVGQYGSVRLNHSILDSGAAGKVKLGYRKYTDIPVNANGEFLDPDGNVIPIIDANGETSYDMLNEIYPFTMFDETNVLPSDFWIADRIEVMFLPADGFDSLNDGKVLSMQGQIWNKHIGIDPFDREQIDKVQTLNFDQKQWFIDNPESFYVTRDKDGVKIIDNITPHASEEEYDPMISEHLWRFMQLQFYSSTQNDWVNYDEALMKEELKTHDTYQLRFVYDMTHAEIDTDVIIDDETLLNIKHSISVVGDPVTLSVYTGARPEPEAPIWPAIVGSVLGTILTLGIFVGIILFIKNKNKKLQEKLASQQADITSDKSE